MQQAWILYFTYFTLWILFSFFNPWSEGRWGSLPVYFWLTCVVLPLGFSALLGWRALKSPYENKLTLEDDWGGPASFFLGVKPGSFLLAMTMVATYVEGSTFLAGPSIALNTGFSWVLLASIQLPSLFLVTAVLGDRLIRLRRKFSFLTLLDLLKARYPSRPLFYLFTFSFISSLILAIVVQLMAAGRMMEGVLGLDYTISLFVFLLVLTGYTLVGGFRHVVITDVIQVGFMTLFIAAFGCVLFWNLGESTLFESLSHKSDAFFDSLGGGTFSPSFFISLWILLGVGFLGTPALVSRLLSIHSLQQIPVIAFWSTLTLSLLVVGIHAFPALGAGYAQDLPANDTTWILLIGQFLGTKGEILFALAPLMAIMSTIDTFILLLASLVWSLWCSVAESLGEKEGTLSFSRGRVSVILGCTGVVFSLALYPPDFLVWLKLFSLAMSQVIFFAPLFLGLVDRKGNNAGVYASFVAGITAFIAWHTKFQGSTLTPHPIIAGLGASVLAYWIVSRLVKPSTCEKQAQDLFRLAFNEDLLGEARK